MGEGTHPAVWATALAIVAGWLLLRLLMGRWERRVAERAGRGEEFVRSRARWRALSLTITGAAVVGVCAYAYALGGLILGSEGVTAFILALGAACAGFGAYRLWRLKSG